MPDWNEMIFNPEISFEEKQDQVYRYQREHNPVYRRYCDALPETAGDGATPPLLPVRAFKDAKVCCGDPGEADLVFASSGTSAMERSRHFLQDRELYHRSLLEGFSTFYSREESVIWAYTPGYSDNPDSSLVYMLDYLVRQDPSGLSRFLPLDEPFDAQDIDRVSGQGKRLILFGAAFGLLDLVEQDTPELPGNSIVIETGGMKTHRRQVDRQELHRRLAEGFGLHPNRIHSEYGMCELLSQAYATGGAWFRPVPWMRVTIRDPRNPMKERKPLQEGLIGVVDLANVHSCSFLLTGDRGVAKPDGQFKVLGRWHARDLRGCNFLIDVD